MNIRDLVLARMQIRRLTPGKLHTLLKGEVGKQSLYDWLGGRTKGIGADSLGLIFDALEIEVIDKESLAKLRAEHDSHKETQATVDRVVYRVLNDMEARFFEVFRSRNPGYVEAPRGSMEPRQFHPPGVRIKRK